MIPDCGVILGLYRGYIGIMEKKMETTIMENQMEKKMENEMETEPSFNTFWSLGSLQETSSHKPLGTRRATLDAVDCWPSEYTIIYNNLLEDILMYNRYIATYFNIRHIMKSALGSQESWCNSTG